MKKKPFEHVSKSPEPKRVNDQHAYIDFKERMQTLQTWVEGALESRPISQVFPDFLKQVRVAATSEQVQAFYTKHQELMKTAKQEGSGGETHRSVQSSKDFTAAVLTWFFETKPRLLPKVQSLTNNLVEKLQEMKQQQAPTSSSMTSPKQNQHSMKALKAVFSFYCKQILMLGKSPTFDRINQGYTTLELGSFFKFCREFGILQKLNKPTLEQVFKKCTAHQRGMDFSQFSQQLKSSPTFALAPQAPLSFSSFWDAPALSTRPKPKACFSARLSLSSLCSGDLPRPSLAATTSSRSCQSCRNQPNCWARCLCASRRSTQTWPS